LEYDSLKRGYWYTREVTEFPLLHLSRNDLVALFLARHALEPLRGTGLERMLTESFRKIAQACPGEVSIQWHELDEAFSVKATGVLMADVGLFGQLMDAVKSRREISFDYQKLTAGVPEPRQVQPWQVRQIEHGWYLLAWDPARGAVRTFALQRIRNLRVLDTPFVRDPSFRAEEHLGVGFGVWSYGGPDRAEYEVCLHFEGYAARVVTERQWHASQEISALEPDGSRIEFRVKLNGLEEITRWVLSWGSRAKVIGPGELREAVQQEVAAMRTEGGGAGGRP
jgi:predicted DNA-binding transcriptional regulator YafY